MTGRGAGLSDEGLKKKQRVIREALAHYAPDPADGIGVLSAVGGLDLAGLAGVCIGGAMYHVPVVLDGVITAAAALAAADYLSGRFRLSAGVPCVGGTCGQADPGKAWTDSGD